MPLVGINKLEHDGLEYLGVYARTSGPAAECAKGRVAAAVVPRELNQSIFELEIDVGEDGSAAFTAPGVFPCPWVKQVVVGIGVEFLHVIGIEFTGIGVFLRRDPLRFGTGMDLPA